MLTIPDLVGLGGWWDRRQRDCELRGKERLSTPNRREACALSHRVAEEKIETPSSVFSEIRFFGSVLF